MTERPEFNAKYGQELSLLHVVHTGSGVVSFLSNGYRGLFSGKGVSGWDMKLTTHLQLMSRSRNHGSIHPLPLYLHGAEGQLQLTIQ